VAARCLSVVDSPPVICEDGTVAGPAMAVRCLGVVDSSPGI
jgi:hypothetical protein